MKMNDLKPNHRVLVIDDNATIHHDFRKILGRSRTPTPRLDTMEATLFQDPEPEAGDSSVTFQVDSAYQGQEGLALVKSALAEHSPYALAFVDVRMPPGWDGIETIVRLWEADPDLQIVICTAYADYSWEELRNRVGQPDNLVVLKKPFDNVEVLQLAHALTKKWLLNLQAGLRMSELESMVAIRTAELVATEDRFAKAFHDNPIPSAIQSLPDRTFVDVNDRFVALTGCSRQDLMNQTPTGRLFWEQPERIDHWFDRLSRNEEIREEPARVRTPAGVSRDVLVSLSPVSMSGRPHAILLVQDISERLLLERQLQQAQKMEGIGQLAAGIAHDFNNILTVIQGHAGLAKLVLGESNAGAESIEQIVKAGDRAATLIRQLLTFSRKQVMQFRNFDLNEGLTNHLAMIQRLMGEHIQVDFQPGSNLPAVHADANMIEQIVMNLAINARDAMPSGGQVKIMTALVQIERSATPMDPEERRGRFVCLTFSDTGSGMSDEVLGHIFEPFFTTKAVGKGTGLGLATVFGIVRQHQGWIDVQSQLGHGTTFWVYLPTSQEAAERPESSRDGTLLRGKETILVAEDEDALRDMVSQILTVQGYTVHVARSGRHALEVWQKANQSIDLLITDLVMPDGIMGGELAERLLAENPGLRVIYTSGYSPGMAGKEISLLENQNFLPKPYSIGKLAQFVRQCLDAPLVKVDKKA